MTTEPVLIQPATAAEVADALRRASDARTSIVIRGAGSKSDWGRTPAPIAAVLDMRRLNRILAHEHGDLTATIEAGARLHDVNEALAVHRQTLPLDPPFADHATIGGLLATNDAGPLRHRYGTPRDLVIGVQLATTDGALSKAGGRVVKNVAGYDLSKLIAGSFGSLAAIVSATFKLSPLPAASKTVRIEARDGHALAHLVQTMMASQLEPIAFEVVVEHTANAGRRTPNLGVLLRFASLPEVVHAQVEEAATSLRGCAGAIDVLEGGAEGVCWHRHASRIWDEPDNAAIVRASWLPANIGSALGELETIATARDDGAACLLGRAAIGAGHIRIDGHAAAQSAAIERLRSSEIFGNVVIVRGSPELKALVDVWGPQGDRQPVFDALKQMFDPHGVLNAGKGPL